MKKTTCLLVVLMLVGYMQAQKTTLKIDTIELNQPCLNSQIYGTLLLPEASQKLPLVLIISGSGPTDRNGNNPMLTSNYLKMIAEELAAHGVASFRYDKRGIAQSKMTLSENDLRFDDYISDAKQWIDRFKNDKRFSSVIVLGHSEGALIGLIAAKESKADKYISVAGCGYSADKIIEQQCKAISPDIYNRAVEIITTLNSGQTVDSVGRDLYALFRPSVQPYLMSWFARDPAKEIATAQMPVLIIQGTTDIQVPTDNAEQLAAANPQAKKVVIEGMNHVLRLAESDRMKNLMTYNNPSLPLHKDIMPTILNFITK